eukprot:1155337-Alexandrium_andersonii.AAC.1
MAERGVQGSAHSKEVWTLWNSNVARYHAFVSKVQQMMVPIFERSIEGRCVLQRPMLNIQDAGVRRK